MTTEQNRGKTHGHVHVHNSITTCDKGHCHMHLGVSSPPIPSGIYDHGQHYHEISGRTSFDHGHYHYYRGTSGPAISLSGGFHTHYVRLRTSFDEGHDHGIEDFLEATMS